MSYRQLPPLNAVRAFEAAARTGGVRAAADELNVSQSAISRHISNLEEHLQTQLFLRRGKRMILTSTGREYLEQLEPALDTIARASIRAMPFQKRKSLAVSAPPTFAVNWLMPRLHRFLDGNPELDLRFVDSSTYPESSSEVDCAIEYRIEPSTRLKSEALFSDEIVPMASAAYVKRFAIRRLEDLQDCTLIETERRLVSWRDVLGQQNWTDQQKTLIVSRSLHALEAARQGLGVALANLHNASSAVSEGELVTPFAIDQNTLPSRPRYFFSTTGDTTLSANALLFREWLIAEINHSLSTVS